MDLTYTEVLYYIHEALQLPTPEQRLSALMKAMDNFGYHRLPGH